MTAARHALATWPAYASFTTTSRPPAYGTRCNIPMPVSLDQPDGAEILHPNSRVARRSTGKPAKTDHFDLSRDRRKCQGHHACALRLRASGNRVSSGRRDGARGADAFSDR